MKNFLYIFLLISLVSCNNIEKKPSAPLVSKEKAINSIIKKTARRLLKEKKLVPFGEGGRAMYDVEMLSLSFKHYGEVSMEEARELILYGVDVFLEEINSDEKIRPYLAEFPFTPNRLRLTISFNKTNGSEVPMGHLCMASLYKNSIDYDITVPEKHHMDTIYTESYEKALTRPHVTLEGQKKVTRILEELNIKR